MLVPDGFLPDFATAVAGDPATPALAVVAGLAEPANPCGFATFPIGCFLSDLGCVAAALAPLFPGTVAAGFASVAGLSGTDGKRCARMSEARIRTASSSVACRSCFSTRDRKSVV